MTSRSIIQNWYEVGGEAEDKSENIRSSKESYGTAQTDLQK